MSTSPGCADWTGGISDLSSSRQISCLQSGFGFEKWEEPGKCGARGERGRDKRDGAVDRQFQEEGIAFPYGIKPALPLWFSWSCNFEYP
jgi:hypothetical protein